MRAVVLYDFLPHDHPFTVGLRKASGWEVDEIGNNFPRAITLGTKLFYLFPLTLWVVLRYFSTSRKFRHVYCWQQNFGIIIALLVRLFSLKFVGDIYVLTFIATEKRRKGVVRWAINYAMGCPNVKRVICFNSVEAELYERIFPALKGKIVATLLAEEFPNAESYEVSNKGYFISAGRSNRDYKFLIDWFSANPERELYIISDGVDLSNARENIKIFNNTFHEDYFRLMAHSHAVIVAFQDETISSGQMVFLHAMQLGKPVIATRSACLTGYLEDNVTGLEIEKDSKSLQNAVEFLDRGDIYKGISSGQKVAHSRDFGFAGMARRIYEMSA
jgi:glycosyltransferase involved in cell wall biosynthesis